jgi:HAD superfamily hydrolase (TIGR01549 family)
MTQISAVIDLDETLAATASSYVRALAVLEGYGISADEFLAAHGRWWKRYQASGCSMEELYLGRMTDCGLSTTLAHEANERYVQATTAVRLRPGARTMLQGARMLGIKTVLLTNGASRSQRDKIARLRIESLVDAILISDEIGHVKPDVAAFQLAVSALRGRADRMVMIGDDLEVDIQGALAAGFAHAIWVTRSTRPAADERVLTVRRLDDALPLLRSLASS